MLLPLLKTFAVLIEQTFFSKKYIYICLSSCMLFGYFLIFYSIALYPIMLPDVYPKEAVPVRSFCRKRFSSVFAPNTVVSIKATPEHEKALQKTFRQYMDHPIFIKHSVPQATFKMPFSDFYVDVDVINGSYKVMSGSFSLVHPMFSESTAEIIQFKQQPYYVVPARVPDVAGFFCQKYMIYEALFPSLQKLNLIVNMFTNEPLLTRVSVLHKVVLPTFSLVACMPTLVILMFAINNDVITYKYLVFAWYGGKRVFNTAAHLAAAFVVLLLQVSTLSACMFASLVIGEYFLNFGENINMLDVVSDTKAYFLYTLIFTSQMSFVSACCGVVFGKAGSYVFIFTLASQILSYIYMASSIFYRPVYYGVFSYVILTPLATYGLLLSDLSKVGRRERLQYLFEYWRTTLGGEALLPHIMYGTFVVYSIFIVLMEIFMSYKDSFMKYFDRRDLNYGSFFGYELRDFSKSRMSLIEKEEDQLPSTDDVVLAFLQVTYTVRQRPILRRCTVTIPFRKVTTIISTSAGFHSVALAILGGTVRKFEGVLFVAHRTNNEPLYKSISCCPAIVFIFPHLSLLKNMLLYLRLVGNESSGLPECQDLLGRVGLMPHILFKVNTISYSKLRLAQTVLAYACSTKLCVLQDPEVDLEPNELVQLRRLLAFVETHTSYKPYHSVLLLCSTTRFAEDVSFNVAFESHGTISFEGTTKFARASLNLHRCLNIYKLPECRPFEIFSVVLKYVTNSEVFFEDDDHMKISVEFANDKMEFDLMKYLVSRRLDHKIRKIALKESELEDAFHKIKMRSFKVRPGYDTLKVIEGVEIEARRQWRWIYHACAFRDSISSQLLTYMLTHSYAVRSAIFFICVEVFVLFLMELCVLYIMPHVHSGVSVLAPFRPDGATRPFAKTDYQCLESDGENPLQQIVVKSLSLKISPMQYGFTAKVVELLGGGIEEVVNGKPPKISFLNSFSGVHRKVVSNIYFFTHVLLWDRLHSAVDCAFGFSTNLFIVLASYSNFTRDMIDLGISPGLYWLTLNSLLLCKIIAVALLRYLVPHAETYMALRYVSLVSHFLAKMMDDVTKMSLYREIVQRHEFQLEYPVVVSGILFIEISASVVFHVLSGNVYMEQNTMSPITFVLIVFNSIFMPCSPTCWYNSQVARKTVETSVTCNSRLVNMICQYHPNTLSVCCGVPDKRASTIKQFLTSPSSIVGAGALSRYVSFLIHFVILMRMQRKDRTTERPGKINLKKLVVDKETSLGKPVACLTVKDLSLTKVGIMLKDINLTIPYKSIFGIYGLNSPSKTCLMQTLLGAYTPEKGTITIANKYKATRLRLSFFHQALSLPAVAKNVYEYLNIMSHYQGAYYDVIQNSIPELADIFKASHILKRQLVSLNKDETRLVQVMAAFVGSPDIVVLDEPTAGLSMAATSAICRGISVMTADATIIISISSTFEVYMYPFEEIAIFNDNTITSIVRPDSLRSIPLGYVLCIFMADLQAQSEKMMKDGITALKSWISVRLPTARMVDSGKVLEVKVDGGSETLENIFETKEFLKKQFDFVSDVGLQNYNDEDEFKRIASALQNR